MTVISPKLVCGDCLNALKNVPDESVHLILCDLPYGTTDYAWDKKIPLDQLWEEYKRVLTPNGTALLFAGGKFLPELMGSQPQLLRYPLIWCKNTKSGFIRAKNRPLSQSEFILVFSKGKTQHKSRAPLSRMTYNPQGLKPFPKERRKRNFTKNDLYGSRPSHKSFPERYIEGNTGYPTDVLNFNTIPSQKKFHPTEKPQDLLEYLIRTYSDEGDTVLDNCMGSGSTGIAALTCGRSFIGMEIAQPFFEIARKRILNTQKFLNKDDV